MEMSNKNPLKHRLTRFFRPSTLLKSSCNAYSSSSIIFTSATNMGSTHSLSTFTIDDTLLLVPGNSGSINSHSKLDRTLTSSSSLQMLSLSCNACRPTKAVEDDVVAVVKKKKKEEEEEEMGRRINENSEFYKIGERDGKTFPHTSPSSPSKNDFHFEHTQEEKEMKTKKHVEKKKTKNFFSNAYGFSSSADNDDYDNDVENGPDQFFSSEEMEAFFSCRSFSSDSFEFYKSLRRKKKNKNKNKKKKKDKRQRSRRTFEVYDGFKPIVSVIEREKSMDGIPVTKISRDPYVDFRDSMVEMIVERQTFGAKDLDKLLHSYLSLNSPLHHSVIIRAFADISGVLRGY